MIITQLANIFTVVIFLAGIHVSAADPCTNRSSLSNYKQFVHKHVLQTVFDRNSVPAWERYLKKQQLWCRTSTQSFMEANQNVESICTRGRRVENSGNLCISRSNMKVYDVITKRRNNGCRINVRPRQTRVIVACNMVNTCCRPVHYQRYIGQRATRDPCLPRRNPGFY